MPNVRIWPRMQTFQVGGGEILFARERLTSFKNLNTFHMLTQEHTKHGCPLWALMLLQDLTGPQI